MKGRRNDVEPHLYEVGDYGFWRGAFYARVPSKHDLVANLAAHKVIEHEDKTISVEPSILVNGGKAESWHGYLTRGEWREC